MAQISEKRWDDLRALSANADPFAAAVQAARIRTGDDTIGAQVENGKTRIVRTTYPAHGFATVEPLTGWLSHSDALAYAESL